MTRSPMIVLGIPTKPLPPSVPARPQPAAHWRKWRNGGAALSALLHGLLMAALTVSLPVFGGPAEDDKAIPVEIVPRAPEPKTERPPEKAGPQGAAKIPVPPKIASAPPPMPAAKAPPAPPPAAPRPEARAAPRWTAPVPPPPAPAPLETRSPPEPRAVPETPRREEPPGGRKVAADDDAPPPADKTGFGYWVLEPLSVNLRNECGLARITGVLHLTERLGEGHYRGTLRTRIGWARCPPEGVSYLVVLRLKGSEVQMTGSGGFVDRGVIRGDTMLLEDAYGRSVWKKR